MRIIGITGPAGSGKDTVADYLALQLQAPHLSGGDYLRGMLASLNLDISKSALADLGVFMRTHYGAGVLVDRVAESYQAEPFVLYSGFRDATSAAHIKSGGGIIVYVTAPTQVRHDRIIFRERAGDAATIRALHRADAAANDSGREHGDNLKAVRDMADCVVVNDGSTAQLEQKLSELIPKLTK